MRLIVAVRDNFFPKSVNDDKSLIGEETILDLLRNVIFIEDQNRPRNANIKNKNKI